ncbi:MAG TPA: (2Fe-2S)-binding protein [Planctomicrobium sp.]|nr:(2Fe-2S)-binding protein [Planctomicrobium sp.]
MAQIVVAADPVLCHCFKVRQSTVTDLVTLMGADTVQDVRKACGAGGGCMACRRRIQNVIDQKKRCEET